MSWWSAFPAILIAGSLLVLPGLAVALALRMRPASALLVAPAFSAGVIGLATTVAGLAGTDWSTWVLAAVAVAVCTLAWPVTRWWHRRHPGPRALRVPRARAWDTSALVVAVAGSVALMVHRMRLVYVHPDHLGQRYDAVFHLNAVRYILDTGNASGLTLGRMLDPEAALAPYPSTWHALAALTTSLSGLDPIVGSNMAQIAVVCVAWPLSAILLARICWGERPAPTLLAASLVSIFPAFPYYFMGYGPLYPNSLAYALLPALLALAVVALRVRPSFGASRWSARWGLLPAAAGIATAQPNGIVAALALSVPLLAVAWSRRFRLLVGRPARTRALAALVAGTALVALVWRTALLGYGDREPYTTAGRALGEALSNSLLGAETAWWPAVLTLGSVVVLMRVPRRRWMLAWVLIAAALHTVAASQPQGSAREAWVGAWYQDPPRLAALVPIVTVVASTGLLLFAARWLRRRAVALVHRKVPRAAPGALRPATGALVGSAAVLVAVTLNTVWGNSSALQEEIGKDRKTYSFDDTPAVLTFQERELIRRLPQHVGPDEVIAVNPWNGGALVYAYTGLPVTQYHMNPPSPGLSVMAALLDEAGPLSPACAVARETGVVWVLDFGTQYLINDVPLSEQYPAFDVGTGLETNYELVDSEGDAAALYRVLRCGG